MLSIIMEESKTLAVIVKNQMPTRQELIKRLLNTLHLNVIERQEFKSRPITLNEVQEAIRLDLTRRNFFPENASLWTEGTAVFEGHFIEKVRDNEFILHCQRSYAVDPNHLAESIKFNYTDFMKLTYDFIKKQFNFNIDGLPIDEK